MAFQAKKIQTLTVTLEPRVGALGKVYRAFKEAGVNVRASWGYEMGEGKATAHFYVEDFKKAKDVLNKVGLKPEEGDACWVQGEDKVGAYADCLQKVEKAGVNIQATDAFALNGKWASVFFCEEKDLPTLWKALEAY